MRLRVQAPGHRGMAEVLEPVLADRKGANPPVPRKEPAWRGLALYRAVGVMVSGSVRADDHYHLAAPGAVHLVALVAQCRIRPPAQQSAVPGGKGAKAPSSGGGLACGGYAFGPWREGGARHRHPGRQWEAREGCPCWSGN
jgi:hypothetical protein